MNLWICLPDNSWFLWRSSVVFVCESCKNTYGSKFSINTAVKFVMSNKKPLSTPCYFLSWLLIIRLEKHDLENWVKNVLPWDWIFIVIRKCYVGGFVLILCMQSCWWTLVDTKLLIKEICHCQLTGWLWRWSSETVWNHCWWFELQQIPGSTRW